MITKPSFLESDIWANGQIEGEHIVTPDNAYISNGWAFGQKPPYTVLNWIQNTTGQMLVHINQNGIAQWDAETSYNVNAYVNHNDSTYIANSISTNSEPGVGVEWDIVLPTIPDNLIVTAEPTRTDGAGKLVQTGADGLIDVSLMPIGGMNYIGNYDMTATAPSPLDAGDFVTALASAVVDASWTGIAGTNAHASQAFIWDGLAWNAMAADTDLMGQYLRRDGTDVGMEGQLKSIVTTGTAPFVVASTTKVDNLNVDYIDGLSSEQLNKFISADTTIYVELTGNDTTGDGTSGNPFATPHKALEYLSAYTFKAGITVTIAIGAGEYTFTETIVVDHPQANQIHILGDALIGNAPRGVWYVPSDGAYDGGATDKWVCTNKAAGDDATDRATNIALAKARYSTIFNFSECNGISIENTTLGNLDNVVLLNDGVGSYNGIVLGHTISSDLEIRAAGGIHLGATKNTCNVVIMGSWNEGISSEYVEAMYVGGVQIGHISGYAIKAKGGGIHGGDTNQSHIFNSGNGPFLTNTTLSYNTFSYTGIANIALYLDGVDIGILRLSAYGCDSIFSFWDSNVSFILAQPLVDNINLFSTMGNSNLIFSDNVGVFSDIDNPISADTWDNVNIFFSQDLANTGATFATPTEVMYKTNYIGKRKTNIKIDSPDVIINASGFTGTLSGSDTDLQTALSTIDSVETSELQKLDQGNGFGWRLLGFDPANYGTLGLNAVDLSQSDTPDIIYGALGWYSFAEGYLTGASGQISHAEGYYTFANGNSSHSEGQATTANGDNSHAEGLNTVATGAESHAEGNGTIALNIASHAQGKFNVGTSLQTIHETGIGADNNNRLNGFEIYSNGRVRAPELTTAIIDADTDGLDTGLSARTLITKEYLTNSLPGIYTQDTDGLVPGPTAAEIADGNLFLRADGNWSTVSTVADLGDLGDVDTTGASTGESLVFNGTTWVPSLVETGSVWPTETDFTSDLLNTGNGPAIFDINYTPGAVSVYVGGVKLRDDEYTATSGTEVVLTQPVDDQTWVQVITEEAITELDYTATQGQTLFDIQTDFGQTYTPGEIAVFVSGIKLRATAYTATNGTSITLNSGVDAGTWVQIVKV